MKYILILLLILLYGCNNHKPFKTITHIIAGNDTIIIDGNYNLEINKITSHHKAHGYFDTTNNVFHDTLWIEWWMGDTYAYDTTTKHYNSFSNKKLQYLLNKYEKNSGISGSVIHDTRKLRYFSCDSMDVGFQQNVAIAFAQDSIFEKDLQKGYRKLSGEPQPSTKTTGQNNAFIGDDGGDILTGSYNTPIGASSIYDTITIFVCKYHGDWYHEGCKYCTAKIGDISIVDNEYQYIYLYDTCYKLNDRTIDNLYFPSDTCKDLFSHIQHVGCCINIAFGRGYLGKESPYSDTLYIGYPASVSYPMCNYAFVATIKNGKYRLEMKLKK